MEILRQIERAASKVTITLTIDEAHLAQQLRETALFHRAYEVYRDIKTSFPIWKRLSSKSGRPAR